MTDVIETPEQETQPAEPKASETSREAIEKALAQVDSGEAAQPVRETDKAAAVLRGEDEPSDDPKPETKDKPSPGSQAAKKGWETRRANQEAEAKAAEKAAEAEKAKSEAEPPKEDKAAPETAEKPAETPKSEAPERFSKAAKAEWEATPQSVRDEIGRSVKELTDGIRQHKESAEKYEALKPFEQLAAQFNADLPTVLNDYAQMSHMLRTNPLQAFNYLAQRHGMTLQQVAEKVLDEQGNEQIGSLQQQVTDLTNKLAAAQSQLSGFQAQRQTDINTKVAEFKDTHDDYAELEPDIIFLLKNHQGLGNDPLERLENAYKRARNMAGKAPISLVPDASAQTEASPPSDFITQTEKAAKSVTGSPSGGSNPVTRQPSKSTSDAVKRAFAKSGGR